MALVNKQEIITWNKHLIISAAIAMKTEHRKGQLPTSELSIQTLIVVEWGSLSTWLWKDGQVVPGGMDCREEVGTSVTHPFSIQWVSSNPWGMEKKNNQILFRLGNLGLIVTLTLHIVWQISTVYFQIFRMLFFLKKNKVAQILFVNRLTYFVSFVVARPKSIHLHIIIVSVFNVDIISEYLSFSGVL